ncbi:MAG: fluoride efflux transporter FluC [Acidimicrobiales bacterium]
MIVVLMVLAAAVGTSVRALAAASLNTRFPYGTLAVNVAGSLALGALVGAGDAWRTVAGVGALGALSTWSSVAIEVGELARDRQGTLAALYLAATVTTGVLAAWIGLQLT